MTGILNSWNDPYVWVGGPIMFSGCSIPLASGVPFSLGSGMPLSFIPYIPDASAVFKTFTTAKCYQCGKFFRVQGGWLVGGGTSEACPHCNAKGNI